MLNDAGLAGKVAIVTGGSRGIGRAIVEMLAAEGADVTFSSRQCDGRVGEVASARPRDTKLRPSRSTCATPRRAAVERVADRASRIDILINNAGLIRDNQLAAMDDDDVKIVLDTNIGGVFNMARAVVPHMIVQRAGKIINVSSVAGEKGGRQTNYAASKGASTPSRVHWRSSSHRARSP